MNVEKELTDIFSDVTANEQAIADLTERVEDNYEGGITLYNELSEKVAEIDLGLRNLSAVYLDEPAPPGSDNDLLDTKTSTDQLSDYVTDPEGMKEEAPPAYHNKCNNCGDLFWTEHGQDNICEDCFAKAAEGMKNYDVEIAGDCVGDLVEPGEYPGTLEGSWICDECKKDWGDGSCIGVGKVDRDRRVFCLIDEGGCGEKAARWHPAPKAPESEVDLYGFIHHKQNGKWSGIETLTREGAHDVLGSALDEITRLQKELGVLKDNFKDVDAMRKKAEADKERLKKRQKWIDEVDRPLHPDDERPWCAAYLEMKAQNQRQDDDLKAAREKIEREQTEHAKAMLDLMRATNKKIERYEEMYMRVESMNVKYCQLGLEAAINNKVLRKDIAYALGALNKEDSDD